jgi:hypothetical protein
MILKCIFLGMIASDNERIRIGLPFESIESYYFRLQNKIMSLNQFEKED